MWGLARSGIEPVSLALADRFLSTVQPGKEVPCEVFSAETKIGMWSLTLIVVAEFLLSVFSGHSNFGVLQDCTCAGLVTQSCPTRCDSMDYSPPGSSCHGILQARILEWVAISFSRGSSWPRDSTRVSCAAGKFFTVWATREARKTLHTSSRIYYIELLFGLCW